MLKVRPETAVPAFKNKDSITAYISYCSIEGSSSYVGLAQAGCAQAGPYRLTYQQILDLNGNGHI